MFSDQEKKLLSKYVTSTDDDIFVVKGMEGMVGAAYARYSRSRGGFREVLLKEFLKEGVIDPKHADQLIERILIAYGDDSVGELEGAHVSFENISMLVTKEIEDRRIGGSPIEQSTRYVFYDMKDDKNNWRYLKDESLTSASFGKIYAEVMDEIFTSYASMVEPMKIYFQKLKPIEEAEYDINGDTKKEKLSDLTDEKEKKAFTITYNFDLRSKACDTLRCLLPLSTLTNLGIFGNGRFFQYLISHLYSCIIPEAVELGEKTFKATSEIIPQYVRRARKNDYLIVNYEKMRKVVSEFFPSNTPEIPNKLPKIKLLEKMDSFDDQLISAMVFPYSNLSLTTIRKRVEVLSILQKEKIISSYIGDRRTRRDRPGRALEEGYALTFGMVTNWGVYKDLMRHRMNTQQRQLFTTKIGFDMPEELAFAGLEEKAKICVRKSDMLFDEISKENSDLAQYAVLHGHYVRWIIGMNDREAMHMLELRSTPQGHPQYRRVVQEMHKEIKKISPWRADAMKFVDYGDYYWSRADSEAKQRVKERKLDEGLK